MHILNITRTLSPTTTVWPGDAPHQQGWTARLGDDSPVNIGRFAQSTHAGTHVDAPLHYIEGGASVEQLPLDAFVGPAIVVAVEDNEPIAPDHVHGLDLDWTPRVLFRTTASRVPDDRWEPAFSPVLPETVEHLGQHGCRLIGTDAPSVDPIDSRDLPAHHALARAGIVNLENLVLCDVEPGVYELLALPLLLVGMDAAPVRAVLRPWSGYAAG